MLARNLNLASNLSDLNSLTSYLYQWKFFDHIPNWSSMSSKVHGHTSLLRCCQKHLVGDKEQNVFILVRECVCATSNAIATFWHFLPRIRAFLLYFIFFRVRLLSVLRGHSVFFSSPPQRPMTSNIEGFSIPDFIHYIYFPILILEKEPVFPLLNVQC